jgi:hypothetical protein
VRLAQARPNTTYVVQRAPEIGRTLGSDGICQRSLGLSPWSPLDPPAPAFVTFPLSGSSATVTTTTAGAAGTDDSGRYVLRCDVPSGRQRNGTHTRTAQRVLHRPREIDGGRVLRCVRRRGESMCESADQGEAWPTADRA